MNKVLANIVEKLNIEQLEIQQVKECQEYLQKILPQLSVPEQKLKVLQSKIRLGQRLVELDLERIRPLNKGTAEKFSDNVW